MTTIDLQDGTRLEMYDSITALPTYAYVDFRANELLAAGIEDYYATLERSIIALSNKEYDKALLEMQNAYVSLKHVEGKYEPSQLEFSWLIKSVDGSEISSFDSEQRRILILDLGKKGLSQEIVNNFLETVKKNLNQN